MYLTSGLVVRAILSSDHLLVQKLADYSHAEPVCMLLHCNEEGKHTAYMRYCFYLPGSAAGPAASHRC